MLQNLRFIFSVLLVFVLTNAFSQPELVPFYYSDVDHNKVFIITDKDTYPVANGKIRTLVPETIEQDGETLVKYHFDDTDLSGQLFKSVSLFKWTQPTSQYINEKFCLYDINLCKNLVRVVRSDGILINTLPDEPFPKYAPFFFAPYYSHQPLAIINHEKVKRKIYESYAVTKEIDGVTYLYFQPFKYDEPVFTNPDKAYTLKDTEFINDDMIDSDISNDAKYIILQRNYKLAQRYNTVIFPVDVPIKDFNHLYNDGKNRMIVYKLESLDQNSLHFIKDISGVFKADTPYIIKSQKTDATTEEQTLSEYYLTDEITTPYDLNIEKNVIDNPDLQVVAQYKHKKKHSVETQKDFDVYVISSNQLINCRNVEDISINRFRWYIKRPKTAVAEPITMTFDGVTEIESVELNNTDNGDVYDLNGIKRGSSEDINSIGKGYYIVDGKVRLISQ